MKLLLALTLIVAGCSKSEARIAERDCTMTPPPATGGYANYACVDGRLVYGADADGPPVFNWENPPVPSLTAPSQ